MKKSSNWLGGAILGLILCALGCSDGVLPSQGGTPEIVVPLPTCKSFTASPEVIQRGGSATLSWEVEGADSLEIVASGASRFSFATDEQFQGSTVVSDIEETTTFILTATKLPPQEGEGEEEGAAPAGMTMASKQIPAPEPEEGAEETPAAPAPQICRLTAKVTVEGAAEETLAIEQFYAEAEEVDAGTTTVLHWKVVPAEAQVSFVSLTGEQPILLGSDCVISGTLEEIELEQGEVPTTYPAEGCASVSPSEDTTYTLTATLGEESASQDLVISVTAQPAIDYFKVNGSSSVQVSSYPAEVELSWEVRPAMATVVIIADPSIDLTQSLLPTVGSMTVTVHQDTIFTLTASVEGEPDASAQVSVTSDLSSLDCATQFLVAGPTSPVFTGEQVRISWSIPAQAAALTTVHVMDSSGAELASVEASSASDVTVAARAGGYSVSFVTAAGQVFCAKPVSAPVVAFDRIATTPGKAVKVVNDPSDATAVYVGLDWDGFNDGSISYYHSAAGVKNVNFFTPFKAFDEITRETTTTFMKDVIKTFPVNAIAKAAEGRLLVATTGVILYENPEAPAAQKGWSVLTPLLRRDLDRSYAGSHPTCFGKTQTGAQARIRGEVISLDQVCDLEMDGSKLYVATDRGLYYLNDVGAYIDDYNSQPWQGRDEGNPTQGKVVNDIFVAGATVYAATSAGIYKMEGGSFDSTPMLEGKAVYSIAVGSTMDSQLLIAGTSEGVYVKSADGDWELKVEGNAIYGVSTDPYVDGVIYAAGASGFYVSRDGGASFVQIIVEPVETAEGTIVEGLEGELRSVAVRYSADPTAEAAKYYVYLATDSGVMKAYLSDVRVGVVEALPAPAGTDVPTDTEGSSDSQAEATAGQ